MTEKFFSNEKSVTFLCLDIDLFVSRYVVKFCT